MPAAERDRIVREFKQALDDHGMNVLRRRIFSTIRFQGCAFTSNDPRVRLYAISKDDRRWTWRETARIFMCFGADAKVRRSMRPRMARGLKWQREAMNFFVLLDGPGYDYKFALEAKPNEPRVTSYLPTTGAMLGLSRRSIIRRW